jgi:spermidine synthase
MASILGLFFASGVAGLIYQVLWVRAFGHVFGNTLASAALVTAVFMCGLGVGSVVGGRLIDRRERHAADGLRWYGYAELAIAGCGLLLALLLPRLTSFSGTLFSYEIEATGWSVLSSSARAFQYAVAIALLAPPSLLMGATLTLLIRFVVADRIELAGWRIGLLYGVNTAGAAAGALLTDFALVPRLGVFDAQLVAIALNVGAGVGALALARRRGGTVRHAPPTIEAATAADPSPEEDSGGGRVLWLMSLGLVLSGAAALGLEILWFRYLAQMLGSLRSTFSLILAVMLVAMWLGSTCAGYLQRRSGRPVLWLIGSQALLVASAVVLLTTIDHGSAHAARLDSIRPDYAEASSAGRAFMELTSYLRPIAVVTALPAFAMGFVFPLANAHVQQTRREVGGRAGYLYLAMTVGNVIGSTVTGFWLLPAVGIHTTLIVLVAGAGASIVPMYLSSSEGHEKAVAVTAKRALAASLLVVGATLFWVSRLSADVLLRPCIPSDQGGTRKVIKVSEGPNETIAVTEIFGLRRSLFTNGHLMSSSNALSQRYMRAFAHIPLLQQEQPRKVLVICFGIGNTLHAASLHPSVQRLELADLSRNVLEHSDYFAASNGSILKDPRVSVFVNDGRLHLRMAQSKSYDLVTLEPPPIMFAGVSALYSRDFYALVRASLADGGFLTQWLPADQVHGPAVLALVRAFIEVFPQSVLLSGDDRHLVLMGRKSDSIALDEAAFERRMAQRPAVAEDLNRVQLGSLLEVIGSFVASSETLFKATEGTAPVTDDNPVTEYSQLTGIRANKMPPALFDVTGLNAWCNGCSERVPGVAAYLRLRGAIYQSTAFLHSGAFRRDADIDAASIPDDRETNAIIDRSEYLQRLTGGRSHTAKNVGKQHLAQGRYAEAASVLARAVYLTPLDADAYYHLGIALTKLGRREEANAQLLRVLQIAPSHPRANAVMCRRAAKRGKLAEARRHCDIAQQSGVALSPQLLELLTQQPPP